MSRRALLGAAIAGAWGLVVAIGAYAVLRAVQSFVYPDPDPGRVAWSAHAGYFWRIATVAYAGGIAAFIALLLGGSRPDRASRALAPAVTVAAAALALQVLFFP